MIHFKNQPKFSEHEVDQKFNDRRRNLLPFMERFLSTDELFKDKTVWVEFSHEGVSSLVSFIETDDQKYVLKIPLRLAAEGEAMFLKEWEAVGVTVPHVFKEGKFGDHPYILMKYIEAPVLSRRSEDELVERKVNVEMGKALSRMHTSETQGYGRIMGGKPEYQEFEAWIRSEDINKRVVAVREGGWLDDEHGPISVAIDILIEYCKAGPASTYCHFDFGANNILDTTPLTIIDPDPMFNNGIIDIGRSMLIAISQGHPDSGEQLKSGYFSDRPLDEKALLASILLNTYWKFPYWHKTGRHEQMEVVKQYLKQNRHLLG